MKNTILIFMITFFGFSVEAQEVKKSKNAKHSFEVNGNCEMCQKRIQKAALSVSGVKSVIWNVQSHQLDLILNEQKSSVLEVKKAIAKVGHDSDDIKATDLDYNNLHGCCVYERK
ncbi:metal transporter [Flavobacterium sp.]|uniref:heavy-metal-associated domain-containing protein n=1 Tax=Flavobacterium sp. TaxID=239 RepID=UPI00286E7C3F|nr:metal transporter [Flavobacterium sp.]